MTLTLLPDRNALDSAFGLREASVTRRLRKAARIAAPHRYIRDLRSLASEAFPLKRGIPPGCLAR